MTTCRKRRQTADPLLLAAMLLFACRGAAPGGGDTEALRPVVFPDLTAAEAGVVEQLGAAQRRLDAALALPDATPEDLAQRFGDLGLLYVTYSFLDAAEVCFANAQTLAPKDYRWPYLLGYLLQQQGLEGASETLQRALALGPAHQPSRIRLARVALERGDRGRARQLFEEVLAVEPDSAAALDGLARVDAAEGDHRAAVARFRRVLELQPSASSVHHALGLSLRALGDLEQARVHLERGGDGPVLFADPLLQPVAQLGRSAEVFLVRAAQAFSEERYDIAAASYRQALELDPKDFTTYKALGFCLEKLGDVPGAIAQLEEALEQGSTGDAARDTLERAEVHRILGGLAVLHGDDTAGIAHFETSLELAPDQLDARFKLANALARGRRFGEAVRHFDRLLEAQPEHVATLEARGAALMNLGRVEAALRDLERAVELAPDDPQPRLRLAEALEWAGRSELAAEQRSQLRNAPGNDQRRAELAVAEASQAIRAGDFASAEAGLRRALVLVPDDADVRFQLASVLGHLERYSEAIAELDVVIAAAPRHVPARRAQVTALLLQERWGPARQRLHESLEVLPRDRQLAHALARLLAAAPDDRVRDARAAVDLAQRVRAADPGAEARETLAMAYAEAGRWGDAVGAQDEALTLADDAARPLAAERLAAYRARRPWRVLSPDEIIRVVVTSATTAG